MTDADRVFTALQTKAAEICGARLFTITVIDRPRDVARRAFTSHPDEYPTSGEKPVTPDGWTRQVLDQQQSFVANSTAEFAIYFPDHALINALGCASALNVPVVADGEVVATVNILDDAGRFTPETVARIEALVAARRDDLVRAVASAPLAP